MKRSQDICVTDEQTDKQTDRTEFIGPLSTPPGDQKQLLVIQHYNDIMTLRFLT